MYIYTVYTVLLDYTLSNHHECQAMRLRQFGLKHFAYEAAQHCTSQQGWNEEPSRDTKTKPWTQNGCV